MHACVYVCVFVYACIYNARCVVQRNRYMDRRGLVRAKTTVCYGKLHTLITVINSLHTDTRAYHRIVAYTVLLNKYPCAEHTHNNFEKFLGQLVETHFVKSVKNNYWSIYIRLDEYTIHSK